jgi:hypothetical protein
VFPRPAVFLKRHGNEPELVGGRQLLETGDLLEVPHAAKLKTRHQQGVKRLACVAHQVRWPERPPPGGRPLAGRAGSRSGHEDDEQSGQRLGKRPCNALRSKELQSARWEIINAHWSVSTGYERGDGPQQRQRSHLSWGTGVAPFA